MRIWLGFAAVLVLGAAQADEWRTASPLPVGGLPASAYGFTFHTPGAGWEVANSLPPYNGVVWGDYGLQFHYPAVDGQSAPPVGHSGASVDVSSVFWGPQSSTRSVTEFDAMMREEFAASRDYYAKQDPKLDTGFQFEQLNGAHCATWTIRSKAQAFDEKEPSQLAYFSDVRTCLHPDFPSLGIRLSYESGTALGFEPGSIALEGKAVLDSLKFTPLLFRARTFVLPGRPMHVIEAEGSIWVSYIEDTGNIEKAPRQGGVARIDPETNALVATIPIRALPGDLAQTPNGLWVKAGKRLLRIDTNSNSVNGKIDLPGNVVSFISGSGFLWALCDDGNKGFGSVDVLRINTATGAIDRIPQPGGVPRDLVFADGTLFVDMGEALMRFDPENLRLAGSFSVEQGTLKFDGRYLWNLVPTDHFVPRRLDPDHRLNAKPFAVKLVRVDPREPNQSPPEIFRYTTPTLFGPHRFVWWGGRFCMQISEGIICLDPAHPAKTAELLPLGDMMWADLLVAAGSLWVTSDRDRSILRIDPK